MQNPTAATSQVKTPQDEVLKRLRLSYDKQDNLNSFSYNYSVDTSYGAGNGTTTGNVTIKTTINEDPLPVTQSFQWRSLKKDGAFTYQADEYGKMSGASMEDMNGYVLNISTEGKF